MKLSTKRIIAKEFLILLSCTFLSALAFVSTIPYNYWVEYEINKLEEIKAPIRNNIDSLSEIISVKLERQQWFFQEMEKLNASGNSHSYIEFWTGAEHLQKSDSLIYRWKNTWTENQKDYFKKMGFENGQELNNFIAISSLSDEEKEIELELKPLNERLNKIERQIKTEQYKIFVHYEKTEFALICLAIIAILAFPIRYLSYAIKWSIRTLKE